MNLFLGAMARGRTGNSQNTLYNTNAQSSNGNANANANTNTFVGFYAASSSTSASTAAAPPPSAAAMQYFSMCRVFSIFLWFVGIMMMSLGGFRTPIGFIGLGLLFLGIVFLVLTSLMMSGSCSSNYCYGTSDPEQPQSRPGGSRTERATLASSGGSSAFTPPFATSYGDPVPAYASPDPAADKPPSYEEVMGGRYPPTVSATILPTIPEGAAPPSAPPPAGLPVNEPSVLPYPSNTLQAPNYGWSVAEPYPPPPPPPADHAQAFQHGSGTSYSADMVAYESSQERGPTSSPPQDTRLVDGVLEMDATLQAPLPDTYNQTQSPPNTQTMQVVDELLSADSVVANVVSSTQAEGSAVTTPLGTTAPSEDSLPPVQVETLHESPIPSTDTQTVDQPLHLIEDGRNSANNSNVLSSQITIEPCAPGEEETERGIADEAGTRDERSSAVNLNNPQMSDRTTVSIVTQSEC